MYFKQMELGPMANYVYLIGDEKTKDLAVVDPAWDVNAIINQATQDGYTIKHILISHGHPDHINGVDDLANRSNARIWMHKDETPWMGKFKEASTLTSSNDQLKMGQTDITFIHTPGHTPGSQCFMVQNHLLSGDTLFINGCGRTDLPGGNADLLYHSLNHTLSKLDDAVVLCPGHNYADKPLSTLGDEKKTQSVFSV